jgi:enediyne biosynthesis thioesterase
MKIENIGLLKQDSALSSNLLSAADLHCEPARTFHRTIDVYLKDSNATGNIYFSRYFEWQGICREGWFFECISSDMLADKGVFITKKAEQNYINETLPFQRVECQMNTCDVKHCSFTLLFQFFVGGKIVSTGSQEIVFANHQKRISRLPAEILAKIREYEVPKDMPRRLM